MNLQLEKEYKETTGGGIWYRITVDDKYINGSFDLEKMQQLYAKIKANPDILKNEMEILQSDEIFVTL